MSQLIDTIKIRMYNTGSVGDCFLLLFEKAGVTTYSVLIDCGGYKTKKESIRKCVQHIKESIVDNSIDLVIATHEHEDHLSGFNQARDIFDEIAFKQVWLSWAENGEDPLAAQLLKEKGKKIKNLQALISKGLASVKQQLRNDIRERGLKRSLSIRKKKYEYALEELEFDSEKSVAGIGGRLKISDAMMYVKKKSKSKAKSRMFRKPGQVIDNLEGAEGVRFFILGPPYDADLHGIKNDLEHSEMYELKARLGLSGSRFDLSNLLNEGNKDLLLPSPFSQAYHMNRLEKKSFMQDYNLKRNNWRQIEYDWIDDAGELAIALTSYVNNTSLAFAIEIESTGEVLLFPADAQSGNWMSWHDDKVKNTLYKNGGKNAKDLLENTVFYKVGHHGSHNGTASNSGLEKMKKDKIVAFVPLVQDKVPEAWGGSDNFPADGLYRKIVEKTNGAVIRTDIGLEGGYDAAKYRKGAYSESEVKKMKAASVKSGDKDGFLYHEWVISAKKK